MIEWEQIPKFFPAPPEPELSGEDLRLYQGWYQTVTFAIPLAFISSLHSIIASRNNSPQQNMAELVDYPLVVDKILDLLLERKQYFNDYLLLLEYQVQILTGIYYSKQSNPLDIADLYFPPNQYPKTSGPLHILACGTKNYIGTVERYKQQYPTVKKNAPSFDSFGNKSHVYALADAILTGRFKL